MIDQADDRLGAWVREVLGDVPVSFAPPGAAAGVHLYLFDLAEAQQPRTAAPPPLSCELRYLVTTAAEEPREAHRQLGDLLFAALADPELDVALGAVPPTFWPALGTAPRPAFVLRVPLERPRELPAAVPVREVVVESGPLGELAGVVLGPGDVPLARAHVELPALSRATVTDARGRFLLSGVPLGAAAGEIRISARGRRFTLPSDQLPEAASGAVASPLIIRLDLETRSGTRPEPMEEEHGH